jgi:hypothetical protein
MRETGRAISESRAALLPKVSLRLTVLNHEGVAEPGKVFMPAELFLFFLPSRNWVRNLEGATRL